MLFILTMMQGSLTFWTLHATHQCPGHQVSLELWHLPLFLLRKGSWWEVDLGLGVAVSKVKLFNVGDNNANANTAAEISGRLSNSHVSLINFNGKINCLRSCMNAGYQYAGTQYSSECWCGNSYGLYGVKPTNECNMPCAGNEGEMCGGANRNSVYTTTHSGILITWDLYLRYLLVV